MDYKNRISAFFLISLFVVSKAQVLRVENITVDSIWNTDTTWFDSQGILQQRTSRDLFLGFTAKGEGSVSCSLAISLDSGKTWLNGMSILRSLDTLFGSSEMNRAFPVRSALFRANVRQRARLRIYGGDRQGVAFRVLCRQYAPRIAAEKRLIEITGNPSESVVIPLKVYSVNQETPVGPIDKYFWDMLGDGVSDDSTRNPETVWSTIVPACATSYCRRGVIVTARDLNGSMSNPETLTVQFGRRSIESPASFQKWLDNHSRSAA